jgi:hypothetical protein
MDYGLECLHTACNNFAPSADAEKGFAKLRREMDGERPEAIAKAMASALYDGLKYGNWPHG